MDEEIILIDDIDAIALELSETGVKRGDGLRRFVRELRVGKLPGIEDINLYMRGLRVEDRVVVLEMLESLRRESPNLTEYELLLVSLGTVSLLKGGQVEMELLTRAINGEEFSESDGTKIRLLDVIGRKQQMLMAIVRKAAKSGDDKKRGLVREFMSRDGIDEIRIKMKKNISVVDADYEVIGEEE